jgi:glycosyltransferase involved in cell wall biosynthesis
VTSRSERGASQAIPVLTVNRVGFLGGAERILVEIGAAALQRGYCPVLACPAPGVLATEARRVGIDVQPVTIDRTKSSLSPVKLLRSLGALRRGQMEILQLARSIQARLIHVHHPVAALYALKAARSLSLPLLIHVHETLPARRSYKLLAKYVYPHCSHFICVSEASGEMVRSFGAPEGRISVIYNGVNRQFLKPAEPADQLRQPGPHIGIFGVIEPRKGQDHFIIAAAKVIEQFPNARFWIVGSLSFADNTEYLNRLHSLAASFSLTDRIHFAGFQDDVPRWMSGMDVVVLASTGFESLPTVLLEACVMGRAVVATDVGGVREIVRDGETGLVIPPGDPVRLGQAISAALGARGKALGSQARRHALQQFGPQRFADQITARYDSEIHRARSGMGHFAAGHRLAEVIR